MSVILNIDTAVESASVGLAKNGQHLCMRANENTREHAAWLHNNIRELLKDGGLSLHDISAVAVSNGPGSYTGLRIGLSAAKGLCYALGIPLITIGTLQVMASAIRSQVSEVILKKAALLCPMIDARRMEVYAALFDTSLQEALPPAAMVLDKNSFDDFLENNTIIFSGNGSLKWRSVCSHHHAIFADHVDSSAMDMTSLSYLYYKQKRFANLPYAEPLYLKEFYTPPRK